MTKIEEIYKLPLITLKLLYVKRMRRYGTTQMHILGSDGEIIETFTFILFDKKTREGKTLVSNGLEFPTIWDAWAWYEDLVRRSFN